MRILVTGAAGFVGSNICHALLRSNDEICGVDDFRFGYKENIPFNETNFSFAIADFNNLKQDFLDEFDVLVHCATSNILYAMDYEIEVYRNNAINTIKLFQKFKGKIVYTSTASVYNNASIIPTPETIPTHTVGAYDTSKLIAELFLQERGNYTTLRLENVYGINQRPTSPYCGVMGKMIHSVLHNLPVKINGDGLSTRSYSFVTDVAQAIVKAVNMPALNTEINIGGGREIDLLTLIEIVFKQAEKKLEIEFIPNRKIDTIKRRCLDSSKAKSLLGWEHTTSLEEGILQTINWQRNEYR